MDYPTRAQILAPTFVRYRQSPRSSKKSSPVRLLISPTFRDVFYFLEQSTLLSFAPLPLVKVCSLLLPYISRVRLFFRLPLSSVPTRWLTLLFGRVEALFSCYASLTSRRRRQIVHRCASNSFQCVYSCLDFVYRPITRKRYRARSHFVRFLCCICCCRARYYFPRRLPGLNRWLDLPTSAFRALLASFDFRSSFVRLHFLLLFASSWRDCTARTFSESPRFLFSPFSRTILGL
mmetsp:Transcript_5923/g.18647  ORF Transcript_5923/g.18647 Transcript_5923/m.18647 type:complete len:234 (+) Transcript_5923:410-1111(+)